MEMWRDDPTISGAITSGTLGVRDGTQEFSSTARALQYFYNNPGTQTTFNWPENSLVTLVSGVDELGNIDYSIERKAVTGVGITVTSGTDGIELVSQHATINTVGDPTLLTLSSGTNPTGGTEYTLGTHAIVSAGSISVISGTETVTISGESSGLGSLPGKTYQISYGNSGVTSNKWLEVGHGNPSNQSPHVLPFASQLIGMTFSNKNDNVDSDIELYVAVSGTGASPLELAVLWQIRDIRIARRTDIIASGINFNPGDKLAVYIRNQGQSPSDSVFNCYLQIDTSSAADVATENFSADLVVP
jgi:hypothetical protein